MLCWVPEAAPNHLRGAEIGRNCSYGLLDARARPEAFSETLGNTFLYFFFWRPNFRKKLFAKTPSRELDPSKKR